MECDAFFLNRVVSLLFTRLVACQRSSSELQYLLSSLIRERYKFVPYWFCGLASLTSLDVLLSLSEPLFVSSIDNNG